MNSRRLDAKSSAPTDIITQDQLAEMTRLRELERAGKALHRDLLEGLINGAEIEPGPLTAWIDLQDQQPLTWETIANVAAAERLARLKLGIGTDAPSDQD